MLLVLKTMRSSVYMKYNRDMDIKTLSNEEIEEAISELSTEYDEIACEIQNSR